jgi:hypothetical protein
MEPMEDIKPISLAPVTTKSGAGHPLKKGRTHSLKQGATSFNRTELNLILSLYGHRVAAGDWRDYTVDFLKDVAIFSIYRRASEVPLYRIEKRPKLARRQGAYSVITATGLILKRGQDLKQVLKVLEAKKLKIVT